MNAEVMRESGPIAELNGVRVFAIICLIGGLTAFFFLTTVFGLNLNSVNAHCADVSVPAAPSQTCRHQASESTATSPASAVPDLKVRTGSNCQACDAT